MRSVSEASAKAMSSASETPGASTASHPNWRAAWATARAGTVRGDGAGQAITNRTAGEPAPSACSMAVGSLLAPPNMPTTRTTERVGPNSSATAAEAAATVSSPGRMEILRRSPLVVLDGAKNLEGAAAASAAVAEEFGPTRSVVLVVGMLGGASKDPTAMLQALGAGSPAVRLVIACPAPSPRTVPALTVAQAARHLGCEAVEAPGVSEALDMAFADASETDLIMVTGSLYVVGAARSALAED